jgi:hypothetical protein
VATTGERRSFFRHLRDGRSLRTNPLTWLAIGEDTEVLPEPRLVRALHDRLGKLVDEVCAKAPLHLRDSRLRRLQAIFQRNILGGEHWSSLAAELFVSRRQFFRERKFLCDELYTALQSDPPRTAAAPTQPSREQLAYNQAYLAFQVGNLAAVERIVDDLCTRLEPGEVRSKALLLAAEAAIDALRFDTAAARCSLALDEVGAFADFEERAIGLVRVNLVRNRYHFFLADYRRAAQDIDAAAHELSRLPRSADPRCAELLRTILQRRAELAFHVGDVDNAVEYIRRCTYAAGPNELAREVDFDLASIEAATEAFAGRYQRGLNVLGQASASAQRLGFNRQVVRIAIERSWVELMVKRDNGVLLAPKLAALTDALHVPAMSLEAALFCAVGERPAAAMKYATSARAAAPSNSTWTARAIQAQAIASLKLGRIVDALDLAAEGERLTERLHNHRIHACAIALMAHINLKSGHARAAQKLRNEASELLRLHAAAAERDMYAQLTRTS